jgi:thioredoxin reductase (NADPH)
MQEYKIDIYGANWCGDCRRTKKFLGEQKIHYNWFDIEKSDATSDYEYVLEVNKTIFGKPKKKIPVVKISRGKEELLLVEPSNVELAEALNIASKASKNFYDVSIVGAGPAGLTAALYLARDGYDVLVLEKSTIGGQAYISNRLDNFPGFPEGISGEDFAKRLRAQVERFGVEIITPHEINYIGPCHEEGTFELCENKEIRTKDGVKISSKAVLIATGSEYRQLKTVPGIDSLVSINVHYCATCDGAFYKNKELFVVGGGNSAFEEGLFLRDKFARKVTILVKGENPNASSLLQDKVADTDGIDVWLNHEIVGVKGENNLESVNVRNNATNSITEHHPDGIFIFIGLTPNTKFLPDSLELDSKGFIITKSGFQTSIKGIFSAGDCRLGSVKQAVSAAGEGAGSAIQIREFLN